MNQTEASQLLAYLAVFDNRNVTDMAASAWAAALADVPLDADTQQVVTDFYKTPPKDPGGRRWMEPHHVISGRRRLREARLEGFVYEMQEGDEDTTTYLRNIKAQREAVASGAVPASSSKLMLKGGPAPQIAAAFAQIGKPVPDEDSPQRTAAKEKIAATRTNPEGPFKVACPKCRASIGKDCTVMVSGTRRKKPHPARVEMARTK